MSDIILVFAITCRAVFFLDVVLVCVYKEVEDTILLELVSPTLVINNLAHCEDATSRVYIKIDHIVRALMILINDVHN